MAKRITKAQIKANLIDSIVALNRKCVCGYIYAAEDFQSFTLLRLEKIFIRFTNNLPVYIPHNNCAYADKKEFELAYLKRLLHKPCNICLEKTDVNSGYCKKCEQYRSKFIQVCVDCGHTNFIATGVKANEIYRCKSCWNKYNENSSIVNDIKVFENQWYNFTNKAAVKYLLFQKFFNVKQGVSIDIKQNNIWNTFFNNEQVQFKLYQSINLLINKFWTYKKQISNPQSFTIMLNCLTEVWNELNTNKQRKYSLSLEQLENKHVYFQDILVNWKNDLKEDFDIVIQILSELILKSDNGKGEALFSLLCVDSICNYTNKDDILFNSGSKAEIKNAANNAAGNIISNRELYRSYNKNYFEQLDEDIEFISSYFSVEDLNKFEEVKSFIQTINSMKNNVDALTQVYWGTETNKKWFRIAYDLISKYNPAVAKNYIVNYFKYTINFNENYTCINTEVDFNNIDDVNVFFMTNYLNYYFNIDNKVENLDYIIFINNESVLTINKKDFTNIDLFRTFIKNVNVLLPSQEYAIINNKVQFNDRNKNRSSKIILK
jgi:hypothetical protein